MRTRLSSLPWQAEFAIVFLAAFSWFIYMSLHTYFVRHIGVVISGSEKLHFVTFEVVPTTLLGAFPRTPGRILTRIGLTPSWRDTAIGIILAFVCYLMYRAAWIALYELWPSLSRGLAVHYSVQSRISPTLMMALLAVNPQFEEVLVAGYVITVLKEK